jgi:hypothetical protein
VAIIDPNGLFMGERLNWCSDDAQLHFPRLYCAANNYARMELNYQRIMTKAYGSFRKPINEEKFWQIIREFRDNFLLLIYEHEGTWWGQWQTNDRYLARHKTAEDRRSPAPPQELQDKYRDDYLTAKRDKQQNHGLADLRGVTPSRAESRGVELAGVGVGVGVGVGGGTGLNPEPFTPEPSATEVPAVFLDLPTNVSGKSYAISEAQVNEWEPLYPAVDVRQQIRNIRGWLDANPSRRKTSRGMARFIAAWLGKTQDKGGSNGFQQAGTGRFTEGDAEEVAGLIGWGKAGQDAARH